MKKLNKKKLLNKNRSIIMIVALIAFVGLLGLIIGNKYYNSAASKKTNPIKVTTNQTFTTVYSTTNKKLNFKKATKAEGSVTYKIISQKNSSGRKVNYFSIPTSTKNKILISGNTLAGKYIVTIRATASGNEYYNSGYKDFTITISIQKADNPMIVEENQSWTTTYSTKKVSKNIVGAMNAIGNVNYKIISQTNEAGEKVKHFKLSGTTLTINARVQPNNYIVVIRATASGNNNYNSVSKDIIMEVIIVDPSPTIPPLPTPTQGTDGTLKIHFINAGGWYDDAILIQSNQATLWIDGGRGNERITEYLNAANVKTIDYVIGSHTEYDHINAQGKIIKNYDVKNVIYPNDIYNCRGRCEAIDVREVISALNSKNMKAKVQEIPSKITVGDLELYFLAPPASKLTYNKNNNSFVFILKFGNNKFIFTGDSDMAVTYQDYANLMLSEAKQLGLPNMNADVLKYPHHGNQAISTYFLDNVKPKYVVVPNVNKGNVPSKNMLNRLASYGATVYRQYDSKTGNILITSDGNNISFKMDVKAGGK